MNLTEHLALRTPFLWVTTEEPGRVLDSVIEQVQDRDVLRMDALDGLIVWNRDEMRWLKVLVEQGPGQVAPTGDLAVAITHVIRIRGVLVIENAHQTSEALTGFFSSVHHKYREAFKSDDLEKLPPQFILLSHKDKLPEEFIRTGTRVTHELPDTEELSRITELIVSRHSMSKDIDTKKIVRAAAGMSETEFINTALLSIRKNSFVDPIFIGDSKLDQLKKEGVLEVRQPKLTVADLGGMDLGKQLVEDVAWAWNNPDEAAEYGVQPLKRILLVGVPGTGKSLLCEATSSLLGLDLAKGGVSNAMSKWVGESEQNMRRMFASLRAMAPIVFWIDEFGRDMSGGQSSGSVDGGTTDRVHGEFLTGLQELDDQVFLMAAANNIESLAPEMLRADRFDKIMFVGFPVHEERIEIFKIHLGDHAVNLDVEALADRTAYFTGAEIKALIKEVRSKIGTREKRHINTQDVITHIPQVRGRVWINRREAMVAMYERALYEWDWASSSQREEAEAVIAAGRGRAMAVAQGAEPAPAATYTPKSFSAKW